MNMLFSKKISKACGFGSLFTILLKMATLFKVSCIIGTRTALFSGACLIMPLSGAWGGVFGALSAGIISFMYSYMLGSGITFKYLAYHIPGIFAALYWANPHWIIRFCVPAICMFGFLAHPVGIQAWGYSLYWLFPLAYCFMPKKSIFYTALASTFTAHAVGSVIWIYADPMVPLIWWSLIPIVFVERIVFASGATIVYMVVNYAKLQLFTPKNITKHITGYRLRFWG